MVLPERECRGAAKGKDADLPSEAVAPLPYRKGLRGCGAPRKAGLALEACEAGLRVDMWLSVSGRTGRESRELALGLVKGLSKSH